MFKYLTIIKYMGNCKYLYMLSDTDFSIDFATDSGARGLAAFIVSEYKKRNLQVAKNVALLYINYIAMWDYPFNSAMKNYILNNHKNWIDHNRPELDYGNKYYPCVVRQIQQFRFGRRN